MTAQRKAFDERDEQALALELELRDRPGRAGAQGLASRVRPRASLPDQQRLQGLRPGPADDRECRPMAGNPLALSGGCGPWSARWSKIIHAWRGSTGLR